MDEKTKRNKTKVIKLNKQNRSYRFELNSGLKWKGLICNLALK